MLNANYWQYPDILYKTNGTIKLKEDYFNSVRQERCNVYVIFEDIHYVIAKNSDDLKTLIKTHNLGQIVTTLVDNMNRLFEGATSFNQPLNNWDVSNVTQMNHMFYGASEYNQPLNNWDVSNVRDKEGMFEQSGMIPSNFPVSLQINQFPNETQMQQFLQSYDFFLNPNKYGQNVVLIGTPSANGMVFRVKYDNQYLIMKVSQHLMSDSLLYEYLTGLCLNHYNYIFPIFSITVALLRLRDNINININRNTNTTSIDFNTDVKFIDSQYLKNNLNSVISDACKNNTLYSVISEYLPIKKSLKDYIHICSTSGLDYYNLFSHLIFLYSCLVGMSDIFTHYDLHLDNVVLVDRHNEEYLDVIIHLANGEDCSIKMLYLPKIIDYGRVYVDCEKVNTRQSVYVNSEKVNTRRLMRNVCEIPACGPDCGSDRGYIFMTQYDKTSKQFARSDASKFFIDRTRTNVSHDLNILYIIKRIPNTPTPPEFKRQILDNIIYQQDSGTPEVVRQNRVNNKIENIFHANEALVQYAKSAEYTNGIEHFMRGKNKFGTLEIWQDRSKPCLLYKNQ